ncbi:MAG: helix-turn-helix transcriptional regulator [Planctomyces sp.]|nr:helix-turn-helix transcriptional regulator [Planctomyces sp.]
MRARSGNPSALDSSTDAIADRLRKLRTERGWSLERLSAACGVSKSMLSQIERGQANPTLAVALKIAAAFGLTIGELVGESAPRASPIEVIRADDPAHHYRNDSDIRIRTLSPLHLEKDVEFYEVLLNPGGALRSQPHFRGTREFLTVERGRVQVTSGEHASELGPGDSANYPADVVHAIENPGRREAVVFLVVRYP